MRFCCLQEHADGGEDRDICESSASQNIFEVGSHWRHVSVVLPLASTLYVIWSVLEKVGLNSGHK